MHSHEPLRLTDRLKSPHPSFPGPGRLMRLLRPIILILLCTVDRLWHQLTMCNTIAAHFTGHDLSGLASVRS